MANCGLTVQLAEHTTCRGLLANMAMATSMKKGGNDTKGREQRSIFSHVDGENFTDCKMSVHLFHFHRAAVHTMNRVVPSVECPLYEMELQRIGVNYLLEQRFISTPLQSGAYLASSLIEASFKGISFSKREARNFPTYDDEVMNTWMCTSNPIRH